MTYLPTCDSPVRSDSEIKKKKNVSKIKTKQIRLLETKKKRTYYLKIK